MTKICSKCSATNAQAARFCVNCGAALGVTHLQGRTLVAQFATASPPATAADVKTAIQRVARIQKACSPVRIASQQRELTALLIDVSGSMESCFKGLVDKAHAAMRAATTHVREKTKLDPDDEIAVAWFSDDAEVVCPMMPLRGNENTIIRAVEALTIQGGTDINAGLEIIRDRVFDWSRQSVVRRIILLTDGQGGDPIRTATELKSRGVVIDCIGVGAKSDPADVDEELLRKVASVIQGQSRYRFITDPQALDKHYTVLASKTRTA